MKKVEHKTHSLDAQDPVDLAKVHSCVIWLYKL